jgi:hypothetical protein
VPSLAIPIQSALATVRDSAGRLTSHAAVLSVVWFTGAVYVWTGLFHGWWPWDEGTIAEPATRILRGELPHRDFVDAYTGALSYVHAAAFLIFGRELTSLRLVLFAAFVAWVPALYFVASRFLGKPEAGAVTLLAIAWSVPNYPASMPSWYCTFLATFGIAALFRQLETGRRRWLFIAGLCGGTSIAVKSVGIYFVAAALIYFVFKANSDGVRSQPRRTVAFAFALSGSVLFLLRTHLDGPVVANFAFPAFVLAALCCWSLRLRRELTTDSDLRRTSPLVTPFLAGVAVPIAAFAAPYVAVGAIGDLATGLWPTRRLDFAALSPPSLWTLVALVPLGLVILLSRDVARRGTGEKAIALIAVVSVGVVVVVASDRSLPYTLTWQSLRALVPVLTLGGVMTVMRRLRRSGDLVGAQRVVLLLSVAAMCSLVQFPYTAPIYFAYVTPFVLLAALAVSTYADLLWRPILWALIAFYLAFAVVRLNPGTLESFGYSYRPAGAMQMLSVSGGGLSVPRDDALIYERVVALVGRHAGASNYMYAAPDCPEVYFLAGLRNPTKTLFEFLDARVPTNRELVATLDAHHVEVVVINRRPVVSDPLSPSLRAALARRFPHAANAGRFVVRWRA